MTLTCTPLMLGLGRAMTPVRGQTASLHQSSLTSRSSYLDRLPEHTHLHLVPVHLEFYLRTISLCLGLIAPAAARPSPHAPSS
jgi:hypothetical protein